MHKNLTIGKMVDILTSDMEQEYIGEYIENIINFPTFKKRKYTFRQILEAEMKSKEDFERLLKEPTYYSQAIKTEMKANHEKKT